MVEVKDLKELKENNKAQVEIVILENIFLTEPLILQPDVSLRGKNSSVHISGETQLIGLTKNNIIKDMTLKTNKDKEAIFFNPKDTEGTFDLKNITAYGAISLISNNAKNDIEVNIENVNIIEADLTHKKEGPQEYGVTVIQGALTIWNQTPNIHFNTEIKDVSIGQENNPVNGSGVFVSGTNDAKIYSNLITTNNIYTNGLLAEGTFDRISGGVFTVLNSYVDRVENKGITKTYGFNDMVLDNWGEVKEWVVRDEVLSEGTSAIGFVNFGYIKKLDIQAPIKTKGTGARGINNYDGTIENLELNSIETKGDGAIGIQISKPMGDIIVHNDIITYGATGESLVKGEIKELSAVGISILDGAEVQSLEVKGNVYTYGKDISPIENEGKVLKGLNILGETLNKKQIIN